MTFALLWITGYFLMTMYQYLQITKEHGKEMELVNKGSLTSAPVIPLHIEKGDFTTGQYTMNCSTIKRLGHYTMNGSIIRTIQHVVIESSTFRQARPHIVCFGDMQGPSHYSMSANTIRSAIRY